MNAELPYMIRIANALKKLSGGSVGSTVATTAKRAASAVRTSPSSSGVTTKDVIDNLENALFTTVTEEVDGEDVDVRYAALARLKETLVKELHDAFFVTVTEEVPVEDGEEGETQEEEVEYSVFHLMRNEIAELKALHIRQILSHLSVQVLNEGEENETSVLVSDITLASQKNVVACGVGDGSESGGGGGSSTLAGLADTSITSPQNGQILVYDTAENLNKWKNVSPTLGMLADVTIDAQNLSGGQALLYDATNHVWAPGTVTDVGTLTIVNTNNTVGTTATTIATINGNAITAKIGSYVPIAGEVTVTGNLTVGANGGTKILTAPYRIETDSICPHTAGTSSIGTQNAPWTKIYVTSVYATDIYGTNILENGTALSSKYQAILPSGTNGQVLTYVIPQGETSGSWVAQNPTGSITDVKVGGSSVVSNGVALIPAIPSANPTVPSGTTPTALSGLKIGESYYSVPTSQVLYTQQTLTTEQKEQARANIGAGTGSSDFSGDYEDLSNKPDLDDYLTSDDFGLFVGESGETENYSGANPLNNPYLLLNAGDVNKGNVRLMGSTGVTVKANGGVVTITGPSLAGYLTDVSYDASAGNKKLTRTVNGNVSDIVTAETIVTDGGGLRAHQYLGFVASTNQGTVNPASGHATTNTTTYLNLIGGTSSAHAFKAGVQITGSQNISVSSVDGVLTITGPATVGENNVIETIKLNDETLDVDNKVVTIAFDLNDITGVNIDTQNLDNGQVLMYNGTSNKWVAGTIPGLTPITIDDEIKSNSSNPVKNSVIYNALQGKQDVIDTDHKLSYDLITDQPTIPTVGNGVLKIRMNNVDNSTTFSANSSSAVTIDLGTVLTTHQDISGKVDKPSNFTNGHLMAFDSNGDIADSGFLATDFVTDSELTSALADYLPLSGGTLTGDLTIGATGTNKQKKLVIYGPNSSAGLRIYGGSSSTAPSTDIYRASDALTIAGDTNVTGGLIVGTYGTTSGKAQYIKIYGKTSTGNASGTPGALRIYGNATTSNASYFVDLYYDQTYLQTSAGMTIGGNSTISGTLDVTGNVSVGANSAVNKNRTLTVYGPSSSAALKIYGGTNVNYYTDIYRSSSALVIDGDVNIGTSSSSHNNRTFKVFGNIGATGNVVAGVTSDRRLKKDIRSITLKEAEDVLSVLNPVVYNWNEKAEELGGLHGAGRGFLADEYLDILPNAGRKIWGEYDAIDYNQVIPYLVAGWQQTNLRIRILEAEVTFLKEENERLNRKVRNAIQ